MKKRPYILITIILIIFSCQKAEISPNFESFNSNDKSLNYRILYPKNFDKNKSYPLTLFLHGIGERGDDNKLQLKYVDKVFLNQNNYDNYQSCLLYTSPSPRDRTRSRMPSSA